MQNFALVGAAGYIAPRHMKAIKDTGNNLIAAYDPNDSVGILDSQFPQALFFTENEQFESFLDSSRRNPAESGINYVSVCSPNYLHTSHIRAGLRNGAHVICEKPLVLEPTDIDTLTRVENETGCRVNSILQLRLHPAIIALQQKVATAASNAKHDVELTYITSRGNWYLKSWKAQEQKSGGIAANIGVHFFDMLHFVFGELQQNIVHLNSLTKAAGYLEFQKARVKWFLSIDKNDIPADHRAEGRTTFRALKIGQELVEFSDGFTELHTASYRKVLAGEGFDLETNRGAIEAVHHIRHSGIVQNAAMKHPLA